MQQNCLSRKLLVGGHLDYKLGGGMFATHIYYTLSAISASIGCRVLNILTI